MMAFPLGKAAILIFLLLISSKESSSAEDHINDDRLHFEFRLILQEVGFLREENQKQNTEIMILKETVQIQNQTITKHEITMKELDHEIKKSANCCKSSYDSQEEQKRIKRPARLLPLQLLFDRDDDDDDRTTKKPPPPKFYGPPTNCSDLARLGYTLNGYYLVKHNYTKTTTDKSYYSSNNTATDTVYCAFKQDGSFNSSRVEQRLELSPPLNKLVIEELDKVLANNNHSEKFTEKKVHEDILELKREMAKLQHGVKHSRSSSESYIGTPYTSTIVCFAVQKLLADSNAIQLAGSSVIRFKEEYLNLGASFRLNESVFIAPKEGIYEFTFNGYKKGINKEHVLKVSLRLNGKKVINSLAEELVGDHPDEYNPVHNFRCPISLRSLLKLKKGDRIDVIRSQGTLHDHDSRFPIHFSGKLLFDEDVKTRKHNSSDVAVYCVLQKRMGFNTSDSVIPFEVESLNVGGAYDVKKKVFIAPVSGIYEFTLKGYKTVLNKVTHISLRLNGKVMTNSLADRIDHHDHHTRFSLNSILKLKKGDVVDVYLGMGQIYDDDNQYTTFTGKLLLMDYQQPENSFNNTPAIFHSLAVFFNVQKTIQFSDRDEVVPFEKNILNIGEAFDMSESALFTAPREGIYEFSFASIKTTRYDVLSISLRLNGNAVTYASADAAKFHPIRTLLTFHYILKMRKGDRVELLLEKGGIFDNMDHYTHFTGKLLFAIENK